MQNDKKLVIVGVIGKSAFPDCNKMAVLEVLNRHPSLLNHEPKEVRYDCYNRKFIYFIQDFIILGANTILLQSLGMHIIFTL